MSSQKTAISLKDILLSISDSLNDVQTELRNMPPYDEFGRANTLYTLPYLDFNIKVEATTQSNAGSKGSTTSGQNSHTNDGNNSSSHESPLDPSDFDDPSSRRVASPGLYRKYGKEKEHANAVMFGLTNPSKGNSSDSTSSKLTSSISGRFVAIPPNEGLPQIYLQETIVQSGAGYELTVLVGNSAGEKIAGVKVEINFVPEASEVTTAPTLSAAEVYTSAQEGDNYGVTAPITILNLSAGKHYVFEINVGPISKLISIT